MIWYHKRNNRSFHGHITECAESSLSSQTTHKRNLCSFLLDGCLLMSVVCFDIFSSTSQLLNLPNGLHCSSPVECAEGSNVSSALSTPLASCCPQLSCTLSGYVNNASIANLSLPHCLSDTFWKSYLLYL